MIGWLIAVLLIALLLRTRLGIFLSWTDHEFLWKIRIGPFAFHPPEEDKKRQNIVSEKQKTKKTSRMTRVRKMLPIIKAHWQELLELIGRVLRAPTADHLYLNILVGGEDPAECAMNYGRLCAGVSAILPVVHHVFEIRKQEIDISCCYESKTTAVSAETLIFLRFGELIVLAAVILRQLLIFRKSIPSTQKAVQ